MTDEQMYYQAGYCRVHKKHVWIGAPRRNGWSNYHCPLCGELVTSEQCNEHEFEPRPELMQQLQALGIVVYHQLQVRHER